MHTNLKILYIYNIELILYILNVRTSLLLAINTYHIIVNIEYWGLAICTVIFMESFSWTRLHFYFRYRYIYLSKIDIFSDYWNFNSGLRKSLIIFLLPLQLPIVIDSVNFVFHSPFSCPKHEYPSQNTIYHNIEWNQFYVPTPQINRTQMNQWTNPIPIILSIVHQ